MRAIPYALSVHHFISSVGADAGFAAVIGLALLVLLFFAHARETAALRRRADDAEDALHRLELYVDQLARSATGPPPRTAPAPAVMGHPQSGVTPPPQSARVAAAQAATAAPIAARTVTPVPAPAGVLAGAPMAPAGVGAPALSAATRLIPAADEGAIAIRANRSETAPPPAAGLTAAAVIDPPAPRPSTAAGGANGGSAAGGVRVAPPPAVSQGDRYPPRPPARPPAAAPASPAAARGRRGGRAGRSRIGRGAMVLAAALVVVIVVVALLILTSSGGGSSKTAGAQQSRATNVPASHRSKSKAAAAVNPAAVTVTVLNGTSTTNLAHDISSKLTTAGYKPGTIATATNQTVSSTIVAYLPNGRSDALAVARSLKLGTGSVQAVDQSTRTVACNGSSTACSAQVVVTVGTDLASNG